MKRWRLLAAAALSVGAANCDSGSLKPGEGSHDASTSADLSAAPDMAMWETAIEYGPAQQLDLSTPDDGGVQ